MITVLGRRNSSNVQRVLWTLQELGLEYENHTVGGSFGHADPEAYRALNPTGMVPTLQDGALTLWESEAIMRYLAARYGAGGPLWPEDPAARAPADAWLSWIATTLGPSFMAVFQRTIRVKRAEQDPAALAPLAEALGERFLMLDAGLGRTPFLSGEAFGLADIPAAILAYRYGALPISRPATPNLDAWYAGVAERPAFKPTVALPIGSCLEEWLEHERAIA